MRDCDNAKRTLNEYINKIETLEKKKNQLFNKDLSEKDIAAFEILLEMLEEDEKKDKKPIGNKRKCKGSYWDCSKQIHFENGIFHGWGIDFSEYDQGFTQYTTAIVELNDGRVVTIPAEDIVFTDRIYLNG